MDPVASYWLTHFAVKAQPRAYSHSTFTAQSPPYCASPLLLAAPGARTSGLHSAYFGIYVTALRSALGPPPTSCTSSTHVACLFIALYFAGVQDRATSPRFFEFGTDFYVHFPAWAGAHFAVELGSTSLFLIMFIRSIRALRRAGPHRGLLKCYAC